MADYYDRYHHDNDFISGGVDENISHLCEPITSILSIEDYKELINAKQPGIFDWKAFPTNFDDVKNVDVRFTFQKATRWAWKMAKEEIASILSNARKPDLLNLSETEKPSDRKIFSLFFAAERRFINILMFHLKVDYVTCLKWLHVIFIQETYQLSSTELYNDEVFKDHLLLNYTESMSVWKKLSIANQSSSKVLAVGRREDFIFEELQSEYNIVSRNLTIRNREGNIEIVVDNDKVFGQNDPKKDTFGLKYTQHVKDNRKGYNCHVAATTCTFSQWAYDGSNKENHPIHASKFF
jgi:hypothetical protein